MWEVVEAALVNSSTQPHVPHGLIAGFQLGFRTKLKRAAYWEDGTPTEETTGCPWSQEEL